MNLAALLVVVAVIAHLGAREAWERAARLFSAEPVTINQITTSNHRACPLPPGSVVLVGDSLTQFGPWDELLPGVRNRGISGDTIAKVRARIGSIMAARPATVFLMVGVNDVHLSGDIGSMVADYGSLLDDMRAAAPAARIYVETLFPVDEARCRNSSNARLSAFNAGIRDAAAARGCPVLDTGIALADNAGALRSDCCVSDGKHISGHGYRLWSDVIAAACAPGGGVAVQSTRPPPSQPEP